MRLGQGRLVRLFMRGKHLLLPRETRIVVRGEREDAGIFVLDCEVLL